MKKYRGNGTYDSKTRILREKKIRKNLLLGTIFLWSHCGTNIYNHSKKLRTKLRFKVGRGGGEIFSFFNNALGKISHS